MKGFFKRQNCQFAIERLEHFLLHRVLFYFIVSVRTVIVPQYFVFLIKLNKLEITITFEIILTFNNANLAQMTLRYYLVPRLFPEA